MLFRDILKQHRFFVSSLESLMSLYSDDTVYL